MARNKANKPRPKQLVALIVDKSGSMGVCQDAVIDGYKEFTENLKGNTTHDVRATLTLFDTEVSVLYANVGCGQIVPLTRENYTPGGCTALNDAIARTLVTIDVELAKLPKDTPVIVCVMTDGQENSSSEFPGMAGRNSVRAMIEERQKRGNWTFVFMGDQFQAQEQAKGFGIPVGNTKGLDYRVETQTSMKRMSASYAALSSSGQRSTKSFFQPNDDDQDAKPVGVTTGSRSG